MAESRKNGGGLFAAARKLAKVAVTRAIERLTGMPLSGDPWAGRPLLEAAKQFPLGFPTVATPMASAPLAAPTPAPAPPRPPVAAPAVARAPVAKPAPPPPPAAKAKDQAKPPAVQPVEAKASEPVVAVKKPLPPPPPPPQDEEPWGLLDLEEAPQTYGQDDVGLLLRNPGAIFLWWEITPAAWDRARAELGGEGRLICRLAVRARGEDGHWREFHQDHHLDWNDGRRYFATPAADAHVSAHIGLVAQDGRFASMISAPSITVPPISVSAREADDWMFVEPVGGPGLLAGGFSARRGSVPIIRARGSARVVALATGSATLGHAATGGEARANEGLPASTFETPGIPLAGSSWPGGLPSASGSTSGAPSGSPSGSSWSGSPTRP